jgi:hypothetical protein
LAVNSHNCLSLKPTQCNACGNPATVCHGGTKWEPKVELCFGRFSSFWPFAHRFRHTSLSPSASPLAHRAFSGRDRLLPRSRSRSPRGPAGSIRASTWTGGLAATAVSACEGLARGARPFDMPTGSTNMVPTHPRPLWVSLMWMGEAHVHSGPACRPCIDEMHARMHAPCIMRMPNVTTRTPTPCHPAGWHSPWGKGRREGPRQPVAWPHQRQRAGQGQRSLGSSLPC